MKRYITALVLAFAAFCSTDITASPVPSVDPSVSSGSLANGLHYYLVANPSVKGTVDMALVQKGGKASETAGNEGRTLAFARHSLDSTAHFGRRIPMDFLMENNVRFSRSGYVTVNEDAAAYHFRNLNLAEGEPAVDSMLLMIFDLAAAGAVHEDEFIRKTLRPENQAIVIAGDINPAEMLKKLRLLSLMVPAGEALPPVAEPSAAGQEGPARECGWSLQVNGLPQAGLASVQMDLPGDPVPEKYLSTTMPVIAEHFWKNMEIIIRSRLEDAFSKAGLSVAGIFFHHESMIDNGRRDHGSFNVVSASADTSAVKDIVEAVISDLKCNGASVEEVSRSRKMNERQLSLSMVSPVRANSVYVRKCISSFVYGAAIFSDKSIADFYLTSAMEDAAAARMLNDYMSELLPALPENGNVSAAGPVTLPPSGLSGLPGPCERMKVRRSVSNKMLGGQTWMFQNGMTALYNKMDTKGNLFFSLVLRGGLAAVKDLRPGEGAFYADLFFNGTIGGMPGREFKRLMEANGVRMEVTVGLADLRISGSAPSDQLDLVMRFLLAANDFSNDSEAGACELRNRAQTLALGKGSSSDRLAMIDSLMCPGYSHTLNRTVSGIRPDLPARAEAFYREQFSKSNDGALILAGDQESSEVRRILENYMGGFKTSANVAGKSFVKYQPVSGASTYIVDGKHDSMDIVFSSRLALTGTSFMSAKIATMALRNAVAAAVAPSGFIVEAKDAFTTFPQERFSIVVSITEADLDGFPSHVQRMGFLNDIYAVREAVSTLVSDGIAKKDLEVFKSALANAYNAVSAHPRFWIGLNAERLSQGKILESESKDKISAVTPESVDEILSLIGRGSRIEYIVNDN